jgi:hypothetical protein
MDFGIKDIRLLCGLKLWLADDVSKPERGLRKTVAATIFGLRLFPKMSGLFQN